MNEKVKDLFLIIFVGAVAIVAYFFYQYNFGIFPSGDKNQNPDIEIIDGNISDEEDASENNSSNKKPSSPNSSQNTTVNTGAPLVTPDGIYLIYYYDSGFYPNDLKIRKGTSVRFINKSDSSMRIFADDQSDLFHKQLNQSQTVGYDGIYEYTFTQIGLWEFVNYSNKNHSGKILVY